MLRARPLLVALAVLLAGIGVAFIVANADGPHPAVAEPLDVCTRHPTHWKCAPPSTTDTTPSTTDTTTGTTPIGTAYFEDDFNGAAGAPPNPAYWTPRGDVCDSGTPSTSCFRDSNAFQDGSGNLVMRVQREPSGWLGKSYSSAFIGTFAYGTGWPPSGVKVSFGVPYHIEMRALMPRADQLWPALWPMNVDRADPVYELDVAEERTSLPTEGGCHQHLWGTGGYSWDGAVAITDMGANWHTYSADVFSDHVDYWVDGVRCGQSPAPGASGGFGILLDNWIADPGSWGAGGKLLDPSDPGPWDLKIDYVRVTT